MKTSVPANSRVRRRGSAVLIVLVLLACMTVFVFTNTQTLRNLKQELKLLDDRQQKKYGPGPGH